MIPVLVLALLAAAGASAQPVDPSCPTVRVPLERRAFSLLDGPRRETLEARLDRIFDGSTEDEDAHEHGHEEEDWSLGLQLKFLDKGVHDDQLHFEAFPGVGHHGLERQLRLDLSPDIAGVRLTHGAKDPWERFSVGAFRVGEVPGFSDLDDGIPLLREDEEHHRSGVIVAGSKGLTEHLGLKGRYFGVDERHDEGTISRRLVELGLGVSPLGDNGGRPWNVHALAGGFRERVKVEEDGERAARSGYGWEAGVAFQAAVAEAFPRVPIANRLEHLVLKVVRGDSPAQGPYWQGGVDAEFELCERVQFFVEGAWRKYLDEGRAAFQDEEGPGVSAGLNIILDKRRR